MRYELTDNEYAAIKPFLPNKPRGVPRVNDRHVLNGIFWVLRAGAAAVQVIDSRHRADARGQYIARHSPNNESVRSISATAGAAG